MLLPHTFFWHDYESFGVNPRRDRPAQFAGIRTDADLNIIADPVNIFCKPASDFVPALQASLVTGITPQYCLMHGLPEYQFAERINQELGAENTVGVGYNTIAFDDEMTRFLLWRNLIAPYDREFKNGCSRWDIMDMMRVAHAFKPDGINWPKNDDGSTSFRLEKLTAANGLTHTSAHDALSDVEGTIGLAKLVKTLYPKLFDYCFALRAKTAVQQIINLRNPRPFIHVGYGHPKENGHIGILMPICESPTNRSEIICWNLMKDPEMLRAMTVEQLKERVFKKSKDMVEGEERIPLTTVTINKSPMVFSAFGMLTPEIKEKWQLNLGSMESNLAKLDDLIKGADLARTLSQVYNRQYDDIEDPDEALYDGFIADGDRRKLDRLRMHVPENLAAAAADMQFQDSKLAEIVFRYRARNFPETLSTEEQQRWHTFIASKIVSGAHGHRTIQSLHDEVTAMYARQDNPPTDREMAIANELLAYAAHINPAGAAPAPSADAEDTSSSQQIALL